MRFLKAMFICLNLLLSSPLWAVTPTLSSDQIMDQQRVKITDLLAQLAAANDQNASLQTSLNQANQSLTAAQNQISSLTASSTVAQQTIDQQTMQIKQLQDSLQAVSQARQAAIQASLSLDDTGVVFRHHTEERMHCLQGQCTGLKLFTLPNRLRDESFGFAQGVLEGAAILAVVFLVGAWYGRWRTTRKLAGEGHQAKARDHKAVAGEDVIASKLDLAHAYLSMENYRGAYQVLQAVKSQGSPSQRREAENLLAMMTKNQRPHS